MKKIISHILNLILIVCIFLSIILLIISNTILNKKYILKVLDTNNYYERIYNNIISSFESNLIPSGIEEEIISKLINQEIVTKDIHNIINHVYNHEELIINTNNIRINFNNEVNNILETNNRIASIEEQDNIKTLENALADIYEDELIYIKEVITPISQYYSMINNLVKASEIILLLIILNLIAIHKFIIKEASKNLSRVLLSVGLINTIIYLAIHNKFNHVLLINKVFSDCLKAIIANMLNYILISGIILMIISLGIMLINIKKNKETKVLN